MILFTAQMLRLVFILIFLLIGYKYFRERLPKKHLAILCLMGIVCAFGANYFSGLFSPLTDTIKLTVSNDNIKTSNGLEICLIGCLVDDKEISSEKILNIENAEGVFIDGVFYWQPKSFDDETSIILNLPVGWNRALIFAGNISDGLLQVSYNENHWRIDSFSDVNSVKYSYISRSETSVLIINQIYYLGLFLTFFSLLSIVLFFLHRTILKFLENSFYFGSWQFIVLGSLCVWILNCNQFCTDFIFSYKNVLVVLICLLYFISAFYIFFLKAQRNNREIVGYVFLGSFLLRAIYVLATSYTATSHDVGEFIGFDTAETSFGHFGYIEYLYKNHQLPDAEHIGLWEFYHPPGFHILSAIILGITRLFNVTEPLCYESLQVVTLFFSCLTIWTVYQIMKEFEIDYKWLICLMSILAIHPFFSIMAVTLNNDCMTMYLMTLIMWNAIRWYKNPSFGRMFFLALFFGIGMFTKFSVAIMSLGIGGMFLYGLWLYRNKAKEIIYQFVLFLTVSVPISLFWPIRNMLKFDLPFIYMYLKNNINDSQYIDGQTLLSFFTLPPLHQFSHAFTIWDPKLENNIWIALIRTSLFDEWQASGFISACALVLLWTSLVLAILMNSLFIWSIFKKKIISIGLKMLLFITYISLLYSYINLNFNYPFICHMNYRLVPIIMLFSFIGTACWLQNKSGGNKILVNFIFCGSIAFAMLALIFNIYIISV